MWRSGLQLCFLAITLLARCSARPVEFELGLHPDIDDDRDVWSDADYTLQAKADRVKELPGAPPGPPLSLFSGYVTVDEDAGRSLFYIFVESRHRPRSDPLVLWLNGGPGCSSLGGGFLSELGPFYPTPGGETLIPNKFAWNREANMLFLESPAGVGFSYSNTSRDLRVGDKRTARDSREFLLRWFDRFPQYRGHKFHLSGESYAGHYVPQLADEILRGNRRDSHEEPINLQGFLVGNVWTDAPTDNEAAVDFWFSHGITSREATEAIKDLCDFSAVGPLRAAQVRAMGRVLLRLRPPLRLVVGNALTDPETDSKGALAFWWSHAIVSTEVRDGAERTCDFANIYPLRRQGEEANDEGEFVAAVPGPRPGAAAPPAGSKAEKCDRYIDQAMREMGGINIYDIYADVCLAGPSSSARQLALMLRDHPAGLSTRPLISQGYGAHYDPCIDSETEAYLNRPEVQAALHANTSGELPGPWQDCTPRIEYSRKDLLSSVLPLYERLLEQDIDILVYSGDVDAIVPVIGTRRWLAGLDLPLTSPWRPWRSHTGQVGGWTAGHGRLTFASVRGAGHMVPYTQPERAFHLFTRWVHQKPL